MKDQPICNMHVHTFNAQYVPDNFVGQFIPFMSRQLTAALKSRWASKLIIRLLKMFPKKNQVAKYAAFLKVGAKKDQYTVFHDLANKEGYPDGTRFVVLPLNFKFMGAGNVSVSYEQQLDDLVKVKRSAGKTLLPFVYIDPRMGSAQENLDFVKKYIEKKGFVGIKMYPALGYYPFDQRLELVYEYAEKMELPILTHCSSTGVFYNDLKNVRKQSEFFNAVSLAKDEQGKNKVYTYSFPPINPKTNKEYPKKLWMNRFADNFLNPQNYRDVLGVYPKLKFCFAHFGLDNDQHNNIIEYNWHEQILNLMREYKEVRTDISYSLHYLDVREKFVGYMQDKTVNGKILYGTDFFMTLMEGRSEQQLFQETKQSFGEDFKKIAGENVNTFLSSQVYSY